MRHRSDAPLGQAFTVTNSSSADCLLAQIADGSLTITSLERDARPFLRLLGSRNYIDGVGREIAGPLATTRAGQQIELNVATDYSGRPALQSTSYSAFRPAVRSYWLIDAPGHYRLTAVYAVPDLGEPTAGACSGSATVTTEFDVGLSFASHNALVGVWYAVSSDQTGSLVTQLIPLP